MGEMTMREMIVSRLLNYYTPSEAETWLHLPHPQLGGKSPDDAIKAGRADEVLAIVRRMDDAVYL